MTVVMPPAHTTTKTPLIGPVESGTLLLMFQIITAKEMICAETRIAQAKPTTTHGWTNNAISMACY